MWAVTVSPNKTSENTASAPCAGSLPASLTERIEQLILSLAKTPSADRFLRQREVLPLSGFGSLSTLKNKIREREFPAPIKISEGRQAWSEREIIAWQQARIAKRNATLNKRNEPELVVPPTANAATT